MVFGNSDNFNSDEKKTRKTKTNKKAGYTGRPACVKSSGSYQSHEDYCYTCGYSSDDSLGYYWNSQSRPQCPPDCDNVQGVENIGDNNCGDPCDRFLPLTQANTRVLLNTSRTALL